MVNSQIEEVQASNPPPTAESANNHGSSTTERTTMATSAISMRPTIDAPLRQFSGEPTDNLDEFIRAVRRLRYIDRSLHDCQLADIAKAQLQGSAYAFLESHPEHESWTLDQLEAALKKEFEPYIDHEEAARAFNTLKKEEYETVAEYKRRIQKEAAALEKTRPRHPSETPAISRHHETQRAKSQFINGLPFDLKKTLVGKENEDLDHLARIAERMDRVLKEERRNMLAITQVNQEGEAEKTPLAAQIPGSVVSPKQPFAAQPATVHPAAVHPAAVHSAHPQQRGVILSPPQQALYPSYQPQAQYFPPHMQQQFQQLLQGAQQFYEFLQHMSFMFQNSPPSTPFYQLQNYDQPDGQ